MSDKPAMPETFPPGYDRLAFGDGYNHAIGLIEEYERDFARIVGVCKEYGQKDVGHRVALKFVQGIAEKHV
jgi:hypothetical protein